MVSGNIVHGSGPGCKRKKLLNERRLRLSAKARGMVCEAVRLLIALAGNMGDCKFECPRQLTEGPVQGIKARAAANIFTGHLFYYKLRVSKNIECGGFRLCGVLQCFQKSDVLGHIVVLMTDPFRDVDDLAAGLFDDDSNTGGSRTAMGSTVNVSN